MEVLAPTPRLKAPAVAEIALVCDTGAGPVDGIRDYTLRLADVLAAVEGVTADVLGQRALHSDLSGYDAIVVQYNPFMYGRRGFAPRLLEAMLGIRRLRTPPRIGLMVHEPFVPMINWRWALMGLWQRGQLLALHALADVVFASIEAWTVMLAQLRPRRPAYHLPVGSNLPDMRPQRAQARELLGISDETFVIAAFGTAHPSRHLDYIVDTANVIAESGIEVALQNLGAGVPPLHGLGRRVHVSQPGYQAPAALAQCLAASDLFLAPFVDGVSTRRTTMMAALQNGLPVVATDGPLTDKILRNRPHALHLVPVARKAAFIEAAMELALTPSARDLLGRAARELYEEQFDWPVTATRLTSCLSSATLRA
jgi:glycosyltransferase involved in cell wall biosynthesis